MQILIMMGPHSRPREIHLTAKHLVLGGIVILLIVFGMIKMFNSFANETRDLLLSMNAKQIIDRRPLIHSENHYEAKLIELQTRLEEAQRKLDQLDALRAQLVRSNGRLNTSGINLNDSSPFSNAQGGPLRPANSANHSFNEDELFGVRLDRALQNSFALQARVSEAQTSLVHSWDIANSVPIGLPLAIPAQPTSGLGYRLDPFTRQIAWHDGTDYPAAYGTPILATADGEVARATWDIEYGNVVELSHKNGVVTRYAHAQELLVKQGDYVKKSQMIAKVGSTGRSTGPHVHYEILRNGVVLGRNR
jgi:murein DD-endopeptidase MepM/ murein hydrolase activator NlpD